MKASLSVVTLLASPALLFSTPTLSQTTQMFPGDIVFVIDESSSMSDEQSAIQSGVPTLANAVIAAGVDGQFAIVGYGDRGVSPMVELTSTADLGNFASAIGNLSSSGSREPGYDALILSTNASAIGQRAGSGLCAVIVTDEPSNADSATQQDALNALQSRNATLFGVLSGTSRVVTSYEPLITATGGSIFSITDLTSNTDTIVAEIGRACSAAIIEQLTEKLDITKSLDSMSADTPSAGVSLSYTSPPPILVTHH